MINENYHYNLNLPPEYGEMIMSFSLEPVSLQSSSKKRRFVKSQIKSKTKQINYLLSGDVKVEIQWLLHEQQRYESSDSPDIDNIIKPILDGLSGPEGVLIDDCQVQTIGSHWIDWSKQEHQINIYIRYIPEEYVNKTNIVFVHMGNNLYTPFNSNIPANTNKILLEYLEMLIEKKNQVLLSTKDYYHAKLFGPSRRVFHKSRIHEDFTLFEKEDFRDLLNTLDK